MIHRFPLSVRMVIVLMMVTGVFVLWRVTSAPPTTAVGDSVGITEALSADTAGYARVEGPRPFTFPLDHGPHPEYKTEWWYLTGHLRTPSGRRFGYQFTLFRTAIRPPAPPATAPTVGTASLATSDSASPPATASATIAPDLERAREDLRTPSAWRTDQIYMGHFAVVDEENQSFRHEERFGRGAAGVAGAQAEPFRVWLDDWSLAAIPADDPSTPAHTGPYGPAMALRAIGDPAALTLTLTPTREMLLQGDRGYSRKGYESGQASYYYSYTRLRSEGRLVVGADTFTVEGYSWLDREWSSSLLSEGQTGWDWFSMRLGDGSDLVFFRLRERNEGDQPYTYGRLRHADGRLQDLTEYTLTPTAFWQPPDVPEAAYPIAWNLVLPEASMDLTITALAPEQELHTTVRYWEGAVDVSGSHRGEGYVELTGYVDEFTRR